MVERAVTGREYIEVEVAYALPGRQTVVKLQLPRGVTAGQAIEASGLLQQFPAIDLASNPVGIYGRVVSMETVLEAGDRVEVYRSLMADPREKRRERVARSRRIKKGANRA